MHLFFAYFVAQCVYTVLILLRGSVSMKGKLLGIFVVLLLVPVMVLDVFAASGSLRVRTEQKGQVEVCFVAEANGPVYQLLDEYGGGRLTFDDTLSPELALWLANRSQEGIKENTDAGVAVFTDLQEGLYLVKQTEGERTFAPFLVSIPWDGSMWDLEVTPISAEQPQTGDDIICSLVIWIAAAGTLLVLRKQIKLLTNHG